jgi:hypothetical protein
MLSLEASIQPLVKAELRTFRIDDLVSGLSELGRTLALRTGAQTWPGPSPVDCRHSMTH